jgi:chloride channel protein, CIC family
MSPPSITDAEPRNQQSRSAAASAANAIWTRARLLVRVDEIWLAVFAASIGACAGGGVAAMNHVTRYLHHLLFKLPVGQGLSASPSVDTLRLLTVPVLGGAVLGLAGLLIAKLRPKGIVDPVEANALYGGRMSLTDSVIVAAQTVWSNGIGGSVGLEAGYAQLGAGIASWSGLRLRLRRSDLRLLVGCGAAAAIAGAFSAPLCGVFYGVELIIANYSLATLPFIIIAALTGTLVSDLLNAGSASLDLSLPNTMPLPAYPLAMLVGIVAGFAAIAIMRGVTSIEAGFRRSGLPVWLRPVVGGALLSLAGLISPATLGSGHSALHMDIGLELPLFTALVLFLTKAVASAISIGSGFRGGLFFASLFLGSLFGKLFADIAMFVPGLPMMPGGFYAVVGMSAMAVAVVGGPMTMTFLALESTGQFSITICVLAAAITASMTVKRVFGYSFSTWRFHLRGTPIRSGADIGWLASLTVGRLMRRGDLRLVHATSPEALRQEAQPGEAQRLVMLNQNGQYAGIVYPAELHSPSAEGKGINALLHHEGEFLLAGMTVKEALAIFETAEADALAVLDNTTNRNVVGLLSEQYALKRYSQELERHKKDIAGV